MSRSSSPRIRRGPPPKAKLSDWNYRSAAWDALLRDFQGRCAYSMQHLQFAGGASAMEVDHYNSRLSGDERHAYTNLFLATRHCNLAKRDQWPDEADLAVGIRFLNPCEEQDYGVHIFEDSETHELIGKTPAGRWHVDVLLLNAPHLVAERERRSRIRQRRLTLGRLLSALREYLPKDKVQVIQTLLNEIRRSRLDENLMIPDIPKR